MICGILSLHHDQLAFEQQVAVPWILSSCTFSTVQDQRSPELQLKRETEIKRRTTEQKTITCGDWSERLNSIITDIKELYQCQTTKTMWIMQSHSHRESTSQVEFTFKSVFAFFARTTCWWWWLEEAFPLSFFCFEKASNSLARVAAKCKKTEKNQNSGGKFTNRKCQTVQPLRVR